MKAKIVIRQNIIGIHDDMGLKALDGYYESPEEIFGSDLSESEILRKLIEKYDDKISSMGDCKVQLVVTDKLKMRSPNQVNENIEKIGKLFPNCVTERKNSRNEPEYAIDFDMLRQELSSVIVEGNEERYQFTWPDKKQSILLANAPIAKTLRPCREESVGKDGTPGGFDSENLYIEGDNLDVLKLLQETYLGKIKMIYD